MFALIAVSIGRFLPMPHVRLVMALSDARFTCEQPDALRAGRYRKKAPPARGQV
jgi:hypothetical protein